VLFDPWKNVFVFSITLENTFEDSYYLKGDIMKALQNNINQKKTLEDSRRHLKCIVPSSKAPRQAPWHLWQL